MNILLDTHLALWALTDHPMLSSVARQFIVDPDNTVYYSSVSAWEVLLKHDSPRNNLSLTPDEFINYCDASGYVPLNMKPKHVLEASRLNIAEVDKLHSDPFDRLLLSQAKSENLLLLTHDEKFCLYKEKCVTIV
jgi:PIN domain nuclease of toxin-antitoxin system